MVRGPSRLPVALVGLLLVLVALAPLTSGQDETQRGHVPQSLWGVKDDVGLTLVSEFLTNYGDRAFWQARPTGEGVRVAVIDTGIDLSHPDLSGTLACGHCWIDLVHGRAQPYDDNGHGTHVAGIIAGRGHVQANPLDSYFPMGARGMASGAELIVAKAMNDTGGGADEDVAEAIRWALDPDRDPSTDDGADIVHLSLGVRAPERETPGTVETGSMTEAAVHEALEAGTFVVMSAGNQGEQGPATPGEVDGVIAVGAIDTQGQVLGFSNRGEGVDVFAPGVVMSAWPVDKDQDGIQDGYTGLAGTSQAAPVVTGALALVLEANPELQGEQGGATKVRHIESLVRSTGTSLDDGGTVGLDANALLASQDRGADGIAVGVVSVLGLLTVAVLVVAGRMTFRWLERHAERYNGEEEGEENGPGPMPGPPPGPIESEPETGPRAEPDAGPETGSGTEPEAGSGQQGDAPAPGDGGTRFRSPDE